MVRILNFCFVAMTGLSILALYHVSERTRVARFELASAERQIADERAAIDVYQTEWEHLASPERIATLAQSKLGLDNTATVQLSSYELLPRNGEDGQTLNASLLRRANAVAPARIGSIVEIAARSGN